MSIQHKMHWVKKRVRSRFEFVVLKSIQTRNGSTMYLNFHSILRHKLSNKPSGQVFKVKESRVFLKIAFVTIRVTDIGTLSQPSKINLFEPIFKIHSFCLQTWNTLKAIQDLLSLIAYFLLRRFLYLKRKHWVHTVGIVWHQKPTVSVIYSGHSLCRSGV